MNYEKKIEFYKNRSIGERFSAAIDFLKQNWKVLYKNIVIFALPLMLVSAYFMQYYMRFVQGLPLGNFSYVLETIAFVLASMLLSVVLYSITGTIIIKYENEELTEESGWNDLGSTFLSLAGKTVKIIFITIVCIILIVLIPLIVGGLTSFSSSLAIIITILFVLLILGGTIALMPSLTLLLFPAYFSEASTFGSITEAFKLGFKNWGSLFVAILLAGIVLVIISTIFSLPYQILAFISPGQVGLLSFIFATIAQLGTLLITPAMIVIFAFQYFSITEKEKGISLQSKVADFENL
jgi:hypothetical protein